MRTETNVFTSTEVSMLRIDDKIAMCRSSRINSVAWQSLADLIFFWEIGICTLRNFLSIYIVHAMLADAAVNSSHLLKHSLVFTLDQSANASRRMFRNVATLLVASQLSSVHCFPLSLLRNGRPLRGAWPANLRTNIWSVWDDRQDDRTIVPFLPTIIHLDLVQFSYEKKVK